MLSFSYCYHIQIGPKWTHYAVAIIFSFGYFDSAVDWSHLINLIFFTSCFQKKKKSNLHFLSDESSFVRANSEGDAFTSRHLFWEKVSLRQRQTTDGESWFGNKLIYLTHISILGNQADIYFEKKFFSTKTTDGESRFGKIFESRYIN